jgi:hypothetical protein
MGPFRNPFPLREKSSQGYNRLEGETQMPALEFWFSGTAFWGAATFIFTAGIAVISIQGGGARRYALFLLPVVIAGWWYSQAASEAEKAKPERDYVYFVLAPNNPTNNDGNGVVLASVATGTLRNVNFGIQTAEERKKGSKEYILGGQIPIINEDETPLLKIPIGDYWIDSDPPTRLGKVLEHIQIERTGDQVIQKDIFVMRKATRENLIPEPPGISFYGVVVLSAVLFAFLSFAVTLEWASRITSPKFEKRDF